MNWQNLFFFVGLLAIAPHESFLCGEDKTCKKVRDCWKTQDKNVIVADNFNGVLRNQSIWKEKTNGCIIFLQKNATRQQKWADRWPQIETKGSAFLLYITKWHINRKTHLTVLKGECKNETSELKGSQCDFNNSTTGRCQVGCLHTGEICKRASYDENVCSETSLRLANRYIINMTETTENCLDCSIKVQKPGEELDPDELSDFGVTVTTSEDGIDPVQAANVMEKMEDLATFINASSAALDLGEEVTGILVKEEPEDIQEISFAYTSPNESIWIIDNRDSLAQFSRSVTVTKEAFRQAIISNTSVPFVALLRFPNLEKDEKNSTLLNNEVVAVEMGAPICNLTDKININFWNVDYEGTPSCQSWNSKGNRPKWTDDGCQTLLNGTNITCLCSHLTFFAILLTPLNKTMTSSDMKNLTIITQVGCSLSMLFLGVILFMHFLFRKTKASSTTKILIHLVSAMFLLDFTFLINHHVAGLKSSIGCAAMAAVMHYFLLATFTWFAVQAFHFCLQLHSGGKLAIRHYMLKVCIISWALPCVVGIALLSTGKYGEQVIYTNDPEENVAMCWMTDSNVHYIVNIGYYAVVFLFTFTTFLVILTRLFYLKRTQKGTAQSGRNILTIFGLCCMLGITWGFAFFAYGPLLIPSYYIFTVLNSFQGFFLFIYYYNTRQVRDIDSGQSGSNGTDSTLSTQDGCENPYKNLPAKR